eukprot:CAMPEP_0194755172 /NCGR_PEP_ID=MMETSP0323_2-20130528/9060_1 /TAXON_ID=2866 ORGANISM="Crypthecodinium cohnii, Strain Seligo" /NCGR_SAMPLE_ID=MMETSP0323_2 /ASSEMBLY_ACC=CAM_ASM_000346 /LENGTH=94 /DNA_ID=CAMNT_0039674087 /DNA_START=137 /DNA_END=421 /DNA_ORIENTATION=-
MGAVQVQVLEQRLIFVDDLIGDQRVSADESVLEFEVFCSDFFQFFPEFHGPQDVVEGEGEDPRFSEHHWNRMDKDLTSGESSSNFLQDFDVDVG